MMENFTQILNEKTKKMGLRTAAIIADILNISEDAAYRRIRDPYTFKADEMIRLAREFQIDLNHFTNANPNWWNTWSSSTAGTTTSSAGRPGAVVSLTKVF